MLLIQSATSMKLFFILLIFWGITYPHPSFAQADDISPLAFAKADETRLGQTESVYISMMLDTIDTAYMSVPSHCDTPEIRRRERFLLASPYLAPPDTIASLLVGKSFYFRHAIDQFHTDPKYFDFLARCLCIAYVNARDEYQAIDAPSPEQILIWPVSPPLGYPVGVDPEDVTDDDARIEYTERLNAFYKFQGLRAAKSRANLTLRKTTESFRRIAKQIMSSGDDQVMERFLEILKEHAGDAAIRDILPDERQREQGTGESIRSSTPRHP